MTAQYSSNDFKSWHIALTLVQFFAKIALIFMQFLTLQKISDLIIISGIYLL